MSFIRRIFYDLSTGTTLYSYMMEGSITPMLPAAEAAMRIFTDYGVLNWDEKIETVEAAFAKTDYNLVQIDVTNTAAVGDSIAYMDNPGAVVRTLAVADTEGRSVTLIFADITFATAEDDAADMRAALELLGVEPITSETEG